MAGAIAGAAGGMKYLVYRMGKRYQKLPEGHGEEMHDEPGILGEEGEDAS